jgi:hypothetical protein
MLPSSEALDICLRAGDLKCLGVLFDAMPQDYYVWRKYIKIDPHMDNDMWEATGMGDAAKKGFLECISLMLDHGHPWCPQVGGSNPGPTATARSSRSVF